MPQNVILDSVAIRKLIPHRFPFLLVDTVIELEPGVKGVGIKNVSANEPFFEGHFPDFPIMPGVLIVEALAQLSGIILASSGQHEGKIGLFAGIDGVRFKRQVKPGDTLRLEMQVGAVRRGIGTGTGTATVDGELACKAELMFAMAPDPRIDS